MILILKKLHKKLKTQSYMPKLMTKMPIIMAQIWCPKSKHHFTAIKLVIKPQSYTTKIALAIGKISLAIFILETRRDHRYLIEVD